MKIAVLDDDVFFLDLIEKYLRKNNFHDIYLFKSLESFFTQKNISFDLLLLDVEINNKNAIDEINKGSPINPLIIYISSHAEYAIQAYDINVIGFVSKQNIDKQLLERISFAQKRIQELKKYFFKSKNGTICIEENKILYFEYSYNTIDVILQNKKRISIVEASLKSLLEILSDNFIRINRTQIVNIHKIRRIHSDSLHISIDTLPLLKISRREWPNLKKRYNILKNYYV